MEEEILFEIFPVHRFQAGYIHDFTAKCFLPGSDYQTRLEVLDRPTQEGYFLLTDAERGVIGYDLPGNVCNLFYEKDKFEAHVTPYHQCFKIKRRSDKSGYVTSMFDYVESINQIDNFFELAQALIRIGILIEYKKLAGIGCSELHFAFDLMDQLFSQKPEVEKLYEKLEALFLPEDEDIILFISTFANVGDMMLKMIPTPAHLPIIAKL